VSKTGRSAGEPYPPGYYLYRADCATVERTLDLLSFCGRVDACASVPPADFMCGDGVLVVRAGDC